MKRRYLATSSTSRRKQLATYALLRPTFLQAHPVCQSCKAERATELHHKAGRRGEWLNYTPFFLALCSSCHRWIHDNGKAAEDQGLLVRIRVPFRDYIKQHPNF